MKSVSSLVYGRYLHELNSAAPLDIDKGTTGPFLGVADIELVAEKAPAA